MTLANAEMPTCPASGRIVKIKWQTQVPPQREFLAALCPEEDGGYSIYAVNIPGVVSQGETKDEAKANVRLAFIAVLEACKKRSSPLPYSSRPPIDLPTNCEQIWITVDG